MKFPKFALSSRRVLICWIITFSLLSICAGAATNASMQREGEFTIRRGSTIEMGNYTSIPEATEPCSPEELDWWNRIRQAHAELVRGYQKTSEKLVRNAKAKFLLLLYEGQQKQYRVPVKDRPTQVLGFGKTAYPKNARNNRIEGVVVLSVEWRSDGQVGDVETVKGLGWGLDEISVQAMRQNIFLPAVKDGAFVTSRTNAECGFDLPGGKRLVIPEKKTD